MAYVALDEKQMPVNFGERYIEAVRDYLNGEALPGEFTLDDTQSRTGLYDLIGYDDGVQPKLDLIACLELMPGDSTLEEGGYVLAFQIPLPNVIDMSGQPQMITTSYIPVREGEWISALKQAADGNALLYNYGVIESVVFSDDPEELPRVIVKINQQETQPEMLYLEAA